MKNDPYEVIGENKISVCAWCFPGEKIFDLFPDLRGCEISHGICPEHLQAHGVLRAVGVNETFLSNGTLKPIKKSMKKIRRIIAALCAVILVHAGGCYTTGHGGHGGGHWAAIQQSAKPL